MDENTMMYGLIITIAWACFVLYWFAASFSAKRTVVRGWRQGGWFRFVIAVVIAFMLVNSPGILLGVPPVPLMALGTVLCLAGIAFAIWARVHLGRNWGMPMSLREGHELVTSGPYRLVRHPIYTGVIAAMLGSAFVSPVWSIIFVLFSAYFVYSATREEKMMLQQFGETYRAYQARSKMIVPFIF